jgi:hypothetical protein
MPNTQNYAQNLKSQAYLHLDSQIISNSFYHGTPLLLRRVASTSFQTRDFSSTCVKEFYQML